MSEIKITPKILRILKAYTRLFKKIEGKYYSSIDKLEKQMRKETGIKDIEFFFCDGEFSGIGNNERTMELIDRYKLEK